MSDYEMIERMIDYHLWAQERCLGSFSTMDPAPAEAMKLFGHIQKADWVWHSRIQGESPKLDLFEDVATPDECRGALEHGRHTWLHLRNGLNKMDLDAEITHRNMEGKEFTNNLRNILVHVLNHGTYHRAQIARIVRESGGTPENTDFIAWAREQ